MNYIISIDQSTSATKAVVFNEQCQLVCRKNVPHKQYYPKPGWVEHDAEEIYRNMVEAVREVVEATKGDDITYTLAITNQRETAVVWTVLRASQYATPLCGSASEVPKYAKTLRVVATQTSSESAADS